MCLNSPLHMLPPISVELQDVLSWKSVIHRRFCFSFNSVMMLLFTTSIEPEIKLFRNLFSQRGSYSCDISQMTLSSALHSVLKRCRAVFHNSLVKVWSHKKGSSYHYMITSRFLFHNIRVLYFSF